MCVCERGREALAESSKPLVASSCHLCLALHQKEVGEKVKWGLKSLASMKKEMRKNHIREQKQEDDWGIEVVQQEKPKNLSKYVVLFTTPH